MWDEYPLSNKAVADAVDELCRMLKDINRPFGRIPFIALGDFCQVSPNVKGQGLAPLALASVKSSSLWKSFQVSTLLEPICGALDLDYSNFVDKKKEINTPPTQPFLF